MKQYLVIGICLCLILVAGCNVVKKEDKETFLEKTSIELDSVTKKELLESLKKEKDIKQRYKEVIKVLKNSDIASDKFDFQEKQKFCNSILQAIKDSKVELIYPSVHTDNYDNYELQKHLKKCSIKNPETIERAITYIRPPDFNHRLNWRLVPYEEKTNKYIAEKMKSSFDYRLYKEELDNNHENGEEVLLFSDGFYSEIQNSPWGTVKFAIFNPNTCKFLGDTVNSSAHNKILLKKYGANSNYIYGLIKYKGKNYIYQVDIANDEDKRVMLQIESLNVTKKLILNNCIIYKQSKENYKLWN